MAVKEVMKREHKPRSGLALGGIGTGWFELRKDGVFYNWNIFNNNPHGTGESFPLAEDSMLFFIVRYQEKGKNPQMKLLQIDQGYEVASIPSHYYTFPWLTGVDEIEYEASFPFTRMTFRDKDMPVDVEMEAFSPFIPHNVKDSALPAAIFNFRVRSKTNNPVDVMLMATMRNGVGYDVPERLYASRLDEGRGYKLFESTCKMDKKASSFGQQVVASLNGQSSYYLGWEHRHPYYEIVIRNPKLPNVDDTAGRNMTDKATGKQRAGARLFSTIAFSKSFKGKGEAFDHSFVTSWYFPNLYSRETGRLEGHSYTNDFADAADVARYVIANQKRLTEQSRAFHDDFFDSTAPAFVLDQVNSQLNTFRTGSWLTKEGNFGIQEGMTPERPWGPLATIDVGMYGAISTAALQPELDKSMMKAHMRLRNEQTGSICHGIQRDFTQNDKREKVGHRLDLPSQYVIMALRGYFWTGDKEYLATIWPSVTEALEYVLRDRDPNGDLLPDMAGAMCTYDNFPMYGAASYVASQWLSALHCAIQAAHALGDEPAAQRYAEVLEKATPVFETKLWNGEFYRLYNDAGGERGDLDEGCLTDQIIGQWANQMVGLDDLLDPARMRKALRTVMATNYQPDYGLLNCRWPGDAFLHDVDKDCWSDQANTCWSGVELAHASLLIYQGLVKQGLEVVRNVDDRYRKSGMYYDHQEFGGHYYRPMSAWAVLNALLGLAIREDFYRFDPRLTDASLKLFFAFGHGTGHYSRSSTKKADKIAIDVRTGTWTPRRLELGTAVKSPARVTVRAAGKAVPQKAYTATFDKGRVTLDFAKALRIPAGKGLAVTVE